MEGINTEAVNWCNRLIATCQDGADGYRTAAGAVEQFGLKELFEEIAEQRDFMVTDLQGEIVSLGGDPNDGGTLGGLLHRGWLNLKSVATDHNEYEILEECEAGDQNAANQYAEALASELPPLTRQLLQTHYDKMVSTLNQVRSARVASR